VTTTPARAGLGVVLMLIAMFAFAAMDAIGEAAATTIGGATLILTGGLNVRHRERVRSR
jgi:hypothetical protein